VWCFRHWNPGDSIVLRYTAIEQEALFPGHFSFPAVFPENIQYGAAHVQVRAPAGMTLYREQIGVARGGAGKEWMDNL